ncbi:MAG: 50S ribosomal protein L23 [Planctomycetaceae bacterium]
MSKIDSRHYEIVRRPRVTEKSLRMVERHRAYPFEVSSSATKVDIRHAVEALFRVKVERVRTMNMPGKIRRLGRRFGKTEEWKKAIVVLQQGHAIENFY